MILQSSGTMDLFNILWVISNDDRWVSDFSIFPPTVTVLRIYGIIIQQLQEWRGETLSEGNCNCSLLWTPYYPLLAIPRSEFGIQHFSAQR